jgi:hypothetical protein
VDIREEVGKIRSGGRGALLLWAAYTSMPCERLCAVVDRPARAAEEWPRRRRTMKVKLRWYVMPSDGGTNDFLTAERDFELPYVPFIGLEIYFLVRAVPPHLAQEEFGGKRDLGYMVAAVEYWPHSGETVVSDSSHDGSTSERSAYSREAWLGWFEDAGFSVRPQTPPHGTRHLRSVE